VYPISHSISIVFPNNWYQIFFLSPSSVFNICFNLYLSAKEAPVSTNFTLFTATFIAEALTEWVGEAFPPVDVEFNGDINGETLKKWTVIW
jgi:hypothetical protein